eukprot:TRINITY_DN46782_c0_g1_i1.p1 TRINITY_DN46782_c0_g1~~TRINITY_DN46782_c0_g1_i1.p1  ORF type:complete len:302 (+),score=-4.15 TRINITY_DN46782_c0_g1_i1:87-992(+)
MSIYTTLEPFVAGGTAACFASTCIHPIDLAKVRLQLFTTMNPEGTKIPSPVSMLRDMIRNEGITSVYAGLSAALMRQAVYGTARIGLHRTFSEILVQRNNGNPLSFGMKTASGMCSGAIAVCIGTPFDVALVRMQADSMRSEAERRNYKNVIDALIRVTKEEGFSKLYSGLSPNILRGMSMNVGMLSCYDQALELIVKYITHDPNVKDPSLTTKILGAGVAGFTAASFSLPFDMIKSRLQNGGGKYTGVVNCATSILKQEGLFAFWTGFTAYYGRCAPHAMIILLISDTIKQQYRTITKNL